MPNHRWLATAAYLVAGSLIFAPLLDATLGISPMHPMEFRWRFGAIGVLANAVIVPNAGILLMLITAISYRHANFRRALGVLALLAAAGWVVAIGLFVLDALQMRASVPAAMKASFTLAGALAIVKMVVDATVLAALGLVGVRGRGTDVSADERGLLVADAQRVRHPS
jgi:hypothetical protein